MLIHTEDKTATRIATSKGRWVCLPARKRPRLTKTGLGIKSAFHGIRLKSYGARYRGYRVHIVAGGCIVVVTNKQRICKVNKTNKARRSSGTYQLLKQLQHTVPRKGAFLLLDLGKNLGVFEKVVFLFQGTSRQKSVNHVGFKKP
jgi:hypothetical protein